MKYVRIKGRCCICDVGPGTAAAYTDSTAMIERPGTAFNMNSPTFFSLLLLAFGIECRAQEAAMAMSATDSAAPVAVKAPHVKRVGSGVKALRPAPSNVTQDKARSDNIRLQGVRSTNVVNSRALDEHVKDSGANRDNILRFEESPSRDLPLR